MLILNADDILKAADPDEMVSAAESALQMQEDGQCLSPPRMHADYGENCLLLMPAFTPRYAGIKAVSLYPGNPSRGLPLLNGVMMLNNGETGEPLALLNAGVLTALRTGAAGGAAIRALTPDNVRVLGLAGAGAQGRQLTLFASHVRPFERLLVYDPNPRQAIAFARDIQTRRPRLDIRIAAHPSELLQHADVLITATTSQHPVFPDNAELLAGKHFVAAGSYKPSARELPDALFPLLKTVWVDTPHAAVESGDLIEPLKKGLLDKNRVKPLTQRLKKDEREQNRAGDNGETTLFKSVGMAFFDLAAAAAIYRRALTLGAGTPVRL